VTDKPAVADVFLDFDGERHRSVPLILRSHQMKVLNLAELLEDVGTRGAHVPEGGITIAARDLDTMLAAQGFILDPETGFSTTLHFLNPGVQMANTLRAVGVPIGAQTADSPFAGAGSFTPHVTVRNLLAQPQNVTLIIEYPGPSGTLHRALAPVLVPAHSTKELSLEAVMGELPSIPYCTIRIQYSGDPGSAIAEVSSVEKDQDLVVDNKLANEGDDMAFSGANPWHADKESRSVLFLSNIGEEDARIGFRIHVGSVTYFLTNILLKPHETKPIDIGQLRDQKKPDVHGALIPAQATDGSVNWRSLDGGPVAGRMLMMKRTGGISSNFDCGDPFCCPPSFVGIDVTGINPEMNPGDTGDCDSMEHLADCNGDYFYDASYSTKWTSEDTNVAVMDSVVPYRVHALSAGSTSIDGELTDFTHEQNGPTRCDTKKMTDNGSCTAVVKPGPPDHASVVVDNLGFPKDCETTGVFLRQMQMQLVDKSGTPIITNPSIQENFSNQTNTTCGNNNPTPSSCAPTGPAVGQFLDSMSVSNDLCNSGIEQNSGCGFSLTSTWSLCGGSTGTLWTSPRIVKSNSVSVNGSTSKYDPGTQFH
jgi:hypothetical protein